MTLTEAPYRLSFELEAQSPMIHFQAREPGATLRASEVKPKLDRFVVARLVNETGLPIDELRKNEEYKEFFLPATGGKNSCALNYKLRIECREPPTVVVINNDGCLTKKNNKNGLDTVEAKEYKSLPKYPIYYGNSGVKEPEKQRLGVVSSPTLVVDCFVPALRERLAKDMEDFLLVTNFGTMQNKGFGGFALKGRRPDENHVAELLKKEMGAAVCLVMQVEPKKRGKTDFEEHFKRIERFYHLMKSGYNNAHKDIKTKKQYIDRVSGKPIPPEYEPSYLFQYMHNSKTIKTGIDNEKAWMKDNGISPVVFTSIKEPETPQSNPNPRYVRAFFGTSSTISYLREDGGRKTITINSKELPRVPSPVFFKIVGDSIYIAAYPIDDALYGKSFTFSGYRSDKLPTPKHSDFTSGSFDMENFMREYADHYNFLIKSRKLPIYLKDAPEVRVL